MRLFVCVIVMALLFEYAPDVVVPSLYISTVVAAVMAFFQDMFEIKRGLGK